MKIDAHVDDLSPVDSGEIRVGTLVRSRIDPLAQGLVVDMMTRTIVTVLWSTPPRETLGVDHRDIW